MAERARRAGVELAGSMAAGLGAYIGLLTKWNRVHNLTALQLEPLADETIDRLIVEPLIGEVLIVPSASLAVDLGSGGGSPAIPLRIARPTLRFVLVESIARKCAFLRQAVRELELTGVDVVNTRFERLSSRLDLVGAADLVTMRAVKADEALWRAATAVLGISGRVLWFGGPGSGSQVNLPPGFRVESSRPLPGQGASNVSSLARAD